MKLSNICQELERIAPTDTCLSYDNVGLLVGDFQKEVKNVLIALDLTQEVLDEAIEKNVDLIITHHPLIFKPLKKINTATVTGKILLKLIKADISYYASHTNLDKSENGTNTFLAKTLGLENYSLIYGEDDVLAFGEKDINLTDLTNTIKEKLNIDYIRFVGDQNRQFKKVGIATGSGDRYSLFSLCKDNDIDILITGDLTYHTMQFAKDIGLSLIDATHFKTENIITEHLKELLDERVEGLNIIVSNIQENIFKTL